MIHIPAEYYQEIYLLVLTIVSLFVFRDYELLKERGDAHLYIKNNKGVVLLCAFMIMYIGLRPIDGYEFVDMSSYAETYSILEERDFEWDWDVYNKIFDNFISWMASRGFDVQTFFVVLATIYFAGMAVACTMLFPRDKMAAFVVCLSAFSTFSYGVNGMKAGVAASLFLIALATDNRKQKWWTLLFILLSWGFHHSMQLPIGAFVVCKVVKNPKYFFWFWIFCLLMSIAHVTFFMRIFESMTDEHGADYLAGTGDAYKGFRLDFVLYSVAPIIIGQIAIKKKKIVSQEYEFLLNLYTLINAIWLLCMYAEFNNRISYLSWFMFPIVLIYPYLNERWGMSQYSTFRKVVIGHLSFTLFMSFIYYGFIRQAIR